MKLSPCLKNKKLHINSLLNAHNVTFKGQIKENVQSSKNTKQQNPQALSAPQYHRKQQKRRSFLNFGNITSVQKKESKCLSTKDQINHFTKEMRDLVNKNVNEQNNPRNFNTKRIYTEQKILQKNACPKTSIQTQLTGIARENLDEFSQNRKQKKKCFSNQDNKNKYFSTEEKTPKNLTFRNSCQQVCKKSRNSSANSKRLEFSSYSHSPPGHMNSLQSLTRITSILKIYPHKSNNIRRNRKDTVMNKYDYECENIRLAQKILKIKPSKLCDIKEQLKFFKKQRYFKELRSCSIDSKEDLQQLDQISQSVTLPRINERYHTLNC